MKTDDKALEKETQELKWTRKAVKIRDIKFIMKLLESDQHINRGSVYCLTKSGLNKLSMEDLGNLRSMISVAFRSIRDAAIEEGQAQEYFGGGGEKTAFIQGIEQKAYDKGRNAERARCAGVRPSRSSGKPLNGEWGQYQSGWDDAVAAYSTAIENKP